LLEIVPWLGLAVSIVALGLTVYTLRLKRLTDLEVAVDNKADAILVNALHARIGMVEDNCIRIETTLVHMPDKDSMHRLERQILVLTGQVGNLAEQVKPIGKMAERMQEAMMDRASDK
jgi:hypothetical protein